MGAAVSIVVVKRVSQPMTRAAVASVTIFMFDAGTISLSGLRS